MKPLRTISKRIGLSSLYTPQAPKTLQEFVQKPQTDTMLDLTMYFQHDDQATWEALENVQALRKLQLKVLFNQYGDDTTDTCKRIETLLTRQAHLTDFAIGFLYENENDNGTFFYPKNVPADTFTAFSEAIVESGNKNFIANIGKIDVKLGDSPVWDWKIKTHYPVPSVEPNKQAAEELIRKTSSVPESLTPEDIREFAERYSAITVLAEDPRALLRAVQQQETLLLLEAIDIRSLTPEEFLHLHANAADIVSRARESGPKTRVIIADRLIQAELASPEAVHFPITEIATPDDLEKLTRSDRRALRTGDRLAKVRTFLEHSTPFSEPNQKEQELEAQFKVLEKSHPRTAKQVTAEFHPQPVVAPSAGDVAPHPEHARMVADILTAASVPLPNIDLPGNTDLGGKPSAMKGPSPRVPR